ncbi:MAG: hypothetical protein WDM91_12075 [Rhizomicrobium sp.]
MRIAVLFLLAALGLSACGAAPDTPLAHALLALKAGDRAAFLRAKDEAQAAARQGWQPPGDATCNISAADLQKLGEASLIDKLDHAELFGLDEDERFVYTIHIAGRTDAAWKDDWESPTLGPILHPGFAEITAAIHAGSCSGVALTAVTNGIPGERERAEVLGDWQQDLQDRDGGEVAFQDRMHRAVANLDGRGFIAEWPPKQDSDGN